MRNIIEIKNEDFIGEGVYQKCYMHPDNDSLCVKISKQDIETTRLSNEINYWKKISKIKIKKNDYQFFSKYRGTLKTNLGTGYVFDLIKNETTNQVSKTLEYYLLNPTDEVSDEMLKSEFKQLIGFMIKYKIIANDIRAKNICCKILKNKTIQLIHVDGVGHRDFIPLVDWFSCLAKKKIERRLVKFNLHDLDIHRNHLIELYSNINKQ